MKALIIEDEKAAMRNLKAVIKESGYDIEIVGETDSIRDSVEWFRNHPMPGLVFMDIHLADGAAFEIFNHIDISCPIIFTTAYDEYALKAFKVNSVDYLLKPITTQDLVRAMHKIGRLGGETVSSVSSSLSKDSCVDVSGNQRVDYSELIRQLKKEDSYKTHFLVPVKADKFIPVDVEEILYFYISDGAVRAVDVNRKEYTFPQTLDELAESLNPRQFFRANRQYILSRKVIKDVDLWFNNRLAVNLKVPCERILISKAKVGEFKDWFTN